MVGLVKNWSTSKTSPPQIPCAFRDLCLGPCHDNHVPQMVAPLNFLSRKVDGWQRSTLVRLGLNLKYSSENHNPLSHQPSNKNVWEPSRNYPSFFCRHVQATHSDSIPIVQTVQTSVFLSVQQTFISSLALIGCKLLHLGRGAGHVDNGSTVMELATNKLQPAELDHVNNLRTAQHEKQLWANGND